FEREADRYAYRILKTATPFVAALRRMAADNLSNLRPHPMYVRFNYSHPPLLARIRELEEMK
ncbi:MAG: M48 family metalloprotease, partial [Deltaproteobacteria bacterium]|nr:M48 family metalloprotease [Deltaproteobacteria bacterium]